MAMAAQRAHHAAAHDPQTNDANLSVIGGSFNDQSKVILA